METEGKAWGVTQLVTRNGACELHRIGIKKGGYCSKHTHQTKWNGFHVERGTLLIRTWEGGIENITTLEAGQYMAVRPGIPHQFEAVTDCLAFELYWAEYSPDDIQRENQGGVRSS